VCGLHRADQAGHRLGIGSPGARIVAGFAFALSPRILTLLGANSVEAWPMAVAPWVVVPLVGLATAAASARPSPVRPIAVACAGGVNGTAVFAILPPALIWLAMLRPRRRSLAALGAWGVAVFAATFWWVAPLLLLGRYSAPILDYTETAAVTTRVTDAMTVLRGASNWLGFHGTPFGAWWPAGGRLALEPSWWSPQSRSRRSASAASADAAYRIDGFWSAACWPASPSSASVTRPICGARSGSGSARYSTPRCRAA